MARPLVLVACLALASRGADAGGRTSKVTIETDPAGAKVYFGLKEDGEVCTTPCTVDAPIGETQIIVEAENRRSIIENLVVPRKTARPMRVTYKLEPAVGALVVEGGNGATIKVDDEDKGKAPGRFDGLPAGAHHVVVENNGKAIYDEFVEIEAGQDATVTPPAVADLPVATGPAIASTAATAAPQPRRRTPAIAVAGTFDFGARHFTYSNNMTPATQRDDQESQLLAGPIVELWPTTLLGLGVLPGLALYARFELGLNSQPVAIVDSKTGMRTQTSLTTAWQSLEISVHHRWTIADTGTVEVGTGYVQDRYQFNGDAAEIANVPDASYKAVRIGGRGSLLLGIVEPYLAVENRLVLSGGAMDGRYRFGASASGVHFSVGAAVRLGHLEARLEGGLTRYSWTFKPDTGAAAQADGGTDQIENATLSIGYAY